MALGVCVDSVTGNTVLVRLSIGPGICIDKNKNK
jgi:hypothetical protein